MRLMKNGSVGQLHLQQPVQLPANLVEKIGDSIAGFRDVQITVREHGRVVFIGAQHLQNRRRHRAPCILVVVAGVVPASGEVDRPAVGVAGGSLGSRIPRMAGGIVGPIAGIDGRLGRIATLEVEGLGRCTQSGVVDIVADIEVVRLGAQCCGVQVVGTGLVQCREIDPPHVVAGSRAIIATTRDLASNNRQRRYQRGVGPADLDRRTRIGTQHRHLRIGRPITEVIQLYGGGNRRCPRRARRRQYEQSRERDPRCHGGSTNVRCRCVHP